MDLISSTLPEELLLTVLSCLDPVSLCNCASVSRSWRIMAEDFWLWRGNVSVALHLGTEPLPLLPQSATDEGGVCRICQFIGRCDQSVGVRELIAFTKVRGEGTGKPSSPKDTSWNVGTSMRQSHRLTTTADRSVTLRTETCSGIC